MKTISKIILFYLRREREREREREKKKKKKRVREGQRGGLVGEKERKKKDIEVCEREFVLVNGLTIFHLFMSLSNVT